MAGIINGTTNFILSKMRDEGLALPRALAQAQALGYAEADPTFDIEGIDAAHKITLLAANAFGMPVRFADAQVEGITRLQGWTWPAPSNWAIASLLACAAAQGGRCRWRGTARAARAGARHAFAGAGMASMNAVMVKGDAAGVTMFYGAGAGSEQTASAVIADLADVARLQGTTPAQRVPHQGFHAHAVNEHRS